MTFEVLKAVGLIGYNYVEKEPGWIPQFEKLAFITKPGFMMMFCIVTVIMAVVSYLLGSLNFAIIISKVKYKDDIRKYGSGNAGMTNMMRTYGKAAGIVTFLGDIFKGIVSVLIATFLMGEACGYIAGIACILGHCYPIWYKFKGGKGVAVAVSIILCLDPLVFLFTILIFIICVAFTRYISLGSMMAALVYPIFLQNFYGVTHGIYHLFHIVTICSIIITLLIIFMHRSNIKRLLDGKENKFSFKKKGTNTPVTEATEASDTKKRSKHHEDDDE